MKKSFFMAVASVLIVTAGLHSEICDISAYVPDVKGSPSEITEYTEKLVDKGGKLVGEAREVSKKITFDYTKNKIEIVLYNNLEKPCEYMLIKYLENKKISVISRKKIDYESKNEFVYRADGGWDVFSVADDGSKEKTVSFFTEKEKGKTVSYYTTSDEYMTIKKTYLDNGSESFVYGYRNNTLDSLLKYEYADKKRSSVFYEDSGDVTTTEEVFDAAGNPVSSKSNGSYLDHNTLYEYVYDAAGNWIQRDTLRKDSRFGGLYLIPESRTIREIAYKKTTASAKSIEPKEFFSEYEPEVASAEEESDTTGSTSKNFSHLSVSDKIDPLDDRKVTTVIIDGEGGGNSYDGSPSLIIRRKEGAAPELYIIWHQYLGMETIVTIRVGDTPAVSAAWGVSTDSKASFYHGDVVSFLKSIRAVDTVIARTTPYGENPVTTTFNVSELKNLGDAYEWLFSADEQGSAESDDR